MTDSLSIILREFSTRSVHRHLLGQCRPRPGFEPKTRFSVVVGAACRPGLGELQRNACNKGDVANCEPERIAGESARRAAINLYGYSREQFLATSASDICPPEERGRSPGGAQAALAEFPWNS
jgi:hypothetical protein